MTAIPAADDPATTAPCRTNPDLWFSDLRNERAAAATICRACPFIDPCREASRGEEAGVWAAMNPTERQQWERTGIIPDDKPRLCRRKLHDLDQPLAASKTGSCRACDADRMRRKRADRKEQQGQRAKLVTA